MNNKILLDKPKVKFESHLTKPTDFPFTIRQHKKHRRSTSGIHESLELLCFLNGEGFVMYDGVRYSVRKDDIIVVNSYAIHQVVSEGELPVFCLIIGREFCRYNGIDPVQLIFQNIIREDEQASALFRRMMEAYANREDPFYNAAFKSAVLDMLVYLCRCYSSPRPEELSQAPSLEYVRRAMTYMKTNFAQKLTSDDIAASVGLSKYHFEREFKRFTGCTPNHYLNAIRCEYARNLLESGHYSVKQTAFLCGFTNNSYFSSVFRRYTGHLPSQVLQPSAGHGDKK